MPDVRLTVRVDFGSERARETSAKNSLSQFSTLLAENTRASIDYADRITASISVESLLGGVRPASYSNRPRSHNAVAAAVIQGRRDWGRCNPIVSYPL